MVRTYDPKMVTLIIGGNIIGGYTDGTFIHLERDEDMWTMKEGADGQAARAKSNNRSGKLTVTLLQSSASNDALSAIATADELTNSGVVPFLLRDASGRTVCSSLSAWITKYPGFDFSKEIADRAWVLQSNAIDIFIGGN